MKYSKIVFTVAGIYGLLVLAPQYFLESRNAVSYPPPLAHPEYFYGFIGVAVAFQIVFLIIAADPVRYRLMIIPSVVEKLSFSIAAAVLYSFGRVYPEVLFFGFLDLVWAVLFTIAFVRTREATDLIPDRRQLF